MRGICLLYIPLGGLCIALFLRGLTPTVPAFHQDESDWLGNTAALGLVLDGDFDHSYWNSYYGWTQPHAVHYLYGIVLRADGITPDMMHGRYEFHRTREWNRRNGRIPSDRILLLGRRFSAICGALCCIVICEIGRRTFGWVVGLTAACWLAGNPLMRVTSQRAMVDGPLTLALSVGILLLLVLYQAWGRRGPWGLLLISVGTGIQFGFAAALKINGGLLCAVAIASLPCFALHQILQARRHKFTQKPHGRRKTNHGRRGKSRRAPTSARPDDDIRSAESLRAGAPAPMKRICFATGSVAVVGVMALATFYALNPQVWPGGITDGAKRMMVRRNIEVSRQQENNPKSALTSVSKRVTAWARACFVRFPTLRWAIGTRDRARSGLWFIEAPLFLLGVGWLIGRVVARARRRSVIDPVCIVGVWMVLHSGVFLLMLPLARPRYYQKYLPLQALLVGIGVLALSQMLTRLCRGRLTRRTATAE